MSSQAIRVLLHGADGRMGRRLLALAPEHPRLQLVALAARQRPAAAAGLAALDADSLALAPPFDVAIDFSLPPAVPGIVALCRQRGAALVSGTTGLDAAADAALEAAADGIPVLWSSNFSLGVAVLQRLAAEAARLLADWDCEIVESHHRDKRDAPSGTALSLGAAVAAGRRQPFAWTDRIGEGAARTPGSIGIASLRGGDVVGEHCLVLHGAGERVELAHRAGHRDIFARGALRAAQWLAGRAPGRYRLDQLLGAESAI